MSKIRTAESADSDLVWGAAAIGEEINRTAQQVYHLHGSGALAGAVSKLGHKTLVASRSVCASCHSRAKPKLKPRTKKTPAAFWPPRGVPVSLA